MAGRPKKLHLSQVSPVLEVRSRLTFGTAASSSECLHTDAASPTSKPGTALIADKFQNATLQQQNAAPGTAQQAPPSLPKSVPFGRSRRMSRSLPELRDMQFVSVLPDVGEEDEDDEDDEGRSLSSDQYREDGEGVGVGGGDMGSDAKRRRRLPWLRKLDFVWSSVCHALGFANIWRFPYYCYSNGGGSFVVPYLIFFVVCGIPFVCMELAVGQLTQSGPIAAFGQLCPLMKGIGVSSLMLSFWLTTYYSVLSSWTLFYTFNSFYSPPRWTRCTNTWNSDTCHDPDATAAQPTNHTTPANHSSWINNFTHPAAEFIDVKLLEKSSSLEVTGELRFELLASVLFVWILSYFALRKTDFLRGSALYVLTLAAHLLLFCLFLRTVALDGAKTGLRQLFQPDWQRMFTPRVLLYALAQAFHSLGVVLGPSILMGSCHKQHNNLLRDTIVLSAVTLLTVLVIGCITFATIGHLALKLDKPFWTVLQDDPSVVFVVYSVVVGSMPLPSCWGVLFYLVLLFLGLDSQIKLMATLVSALKEAYTLYIKQRFQGHSLFLAVICGFCFAIAIPYITQAGIFFFQLVDHYTAVVATTVVAFFEVLTLGVLYGPGNLSSCIRQMTGKPPSYFYQFCWMILAPFTILITVVYWCIAGASSSQMVKTGYQYPEWAHALGWVIFALTVCWIPALAVAAYRKMPDSDIINKLRAATQPRLRSPSDSRWEAKPVIILNGSTVTASEFPDYKMPELPGMPNAVQSYVDKHAPQVLNKDETAF